MAEHDQREICVRTLHRMIAYLRGEANRLRIPDVALLLQHAEDAVLAFPPAVAVDGGLGPRPVHADRVEH